MKRILRLLILICLAILAACTPDIQVPEQTPTPLAVSSSATPSATPTMLPTATAVPPPASPSASDLPPASPTPELVVAFPDYECPLEVAVATPSSHPPATVVFVGPDGIYRWQETSGQSDLLFAASDVTALKMSDDGQRIAFTRANGDDAAEGIALWVMDSAGQNGRELLSAADFNGRYATPDDLYIIPRRLDWVPGSHTLAYTTIGHQGELLVEFYDDLHLVDADSVAISTLLPPGEGGDFFYSPDAAQIALVNDTALSLINSDGSNLRPNVLTWEPLGLSHEYHRPAPAWLPDSSALLIAPSNATDNIDATYNPDASSTIWRVSAEGTPQQLTTMVGAPLWLAFSPDGRQVAFTRNIDEHLTRDLHIAAADNAWNIVYARDEGVDFRGWLPDSSGFVLSINREAPQLGRLCQPPTPLPLPDTPDSFVRRITWVDPTRFLFTIDEPPQLLLADLAGTTTPVGSLRPEYFFGVDALTAFDFYVAK